MALETSPPEGMSWPPGTFWAWRPPLWREGPISPSTPVSGDDVGFGLKTYFDGPQGAVTLAPEAAGGVVLGTEGNAGSFASLVFDLPGDGRAALTPRSLVELHGRARLEGDAALHTRINLRHGPNVSTQTRPARLSDGALSAVFDLAHMDLSPLGIAQAWVDLFLSQPGAAQLCLVDLCVSARPRAEL